MSRRRPCMYYKCPNFNAKTNAYQMFHFPNPELPGSQEENRCKEWMVRTCNPEVLSMGHLKVVQAQKLICKDHFTEDQFINLKRNKLKPNQVPQRNVLHGKADDICHEPYAPVVSESAADAEQRVIAETVEDVQAPEPLVVTGEPNSPEPQVAVPEPETPVQNTAKRSTGKRVSNRAILKESGLKPADVTPRKARMLQNSRKYHSKMVRLGRKLQKMQGNVKKMQFSLANDKLWDEVGNVLSPGLRLLVHSERNNFMKRPSARRYSEDVQAFCLGVYKRGPRVYRFLSRFIRLPSERTVQGWLRRIPLDTGINKELLDHLAPLVSKWSPLDRKCVVMFDEVKLKPHLAYWRGKEYVEGYADFGEQGRQRQVADHALVFMVQGIKRRWKQPIAYYFVSKTCPTARLAVIIKEVITALQSIGLQVEATASDQGSTNRAAINELGKTAGARGQTENVFMCNGALIQHFYDMAHVLKGFQNNFRRSDVLTPHGVAKWSHLVDAFNLDKDFNKMLFKLTDAHMNPEGRFKMKVAPAAQVLSRSMATFIGTIRKASDGKHLPNSEATEKVCEVVNRAFDLCNGPSGPRDTTVVRTNVTENTHHINAWGEVKRELKQWKFKRNTGPKAGTIFTPPSLNSWIENLSGFQHIWRKLNGEGLKVLNLRAFGSDAIENFFGVCKQSCGCNTDPTTIQFAAAFKTAIVNNLAGRGRGQNCEDDAGKLLSNMRSFLSVAKKKKEAPKSFTDLPAPGVAVGHNLLRQAEIDRSDPRLGSGIRKAGRMAAAYVVGAILRRIAPPTRSTDQQTCQVCRNNLHAAPDEISNDFLWIMGKEYTPANRALVYPKPEAVNFFLLARHNFCKTWFNFDYRRDLRARVLHMIGLVDDFTWLTCTVHKDTVRESLLQLTADFYIKTMVKRINRRHKMRLSDKKASSYEEIENEDDDDVA